MRQTCNFVAENSGAGFNAIGIELETFSNRYNNFSPLNFYEKGQSGRAGFCDKRGGAVIKNSQTVSGRQPTLREHQDRAFALKKFQRMPNGSFNPLPAIRRKAARQAVDKL